MFDCDGQDFDVILADPPWSFSGNSAARPDLPTWQGGLTHYRSRPGSRRLLRSVTSHVSRTKLRQWLKRGWWRKRRLNPLFVEWLVNTIHNSRGSR